MDKKQKKKIATELFLSMLATAIVTTLSVVILLLSVLGR